MPISRPKNDPSEYGGKTGEHGFQPEEPTDARSPNYDFPARGGHSLTASEQLRLAYSSGQVEDPNIGRQPGAFRGNAPQEEWEEPEPPEQESL